MEENILDAPSLENTEIHKAKLWRRLLASIIDVFILILISLILGILDLGNLYLIIFLVILIGYKLGMEYMYGATIGKLIFRIRIVTLKMESATLFQVIVRNSIIVANQLIKILMAYRVIGYEEAFDIAVPFVLVQVLFGLIFCIDVIVLLFNRNDQALHDLMAKTIVIDKGVKR